MVPALCERMIPIPPPACQRTQRKCRLALHLDALTLVTRCTSRCSPSSGSGRPTSNSMQRVIDRAG